MSIFVTVAIFLVLASSCSHDSGGRSVKDSRRGAVQAETQQERQLLAAVKKYNNAFHTGDYDTAQRMRNDLCAELSWEEGLRGLVQEAADRYGEPQTIISFGAQVKPSIAFVTYGFEDSSLDVRREAWTAGRAGWEWGNC